MEKDFRRDDFRLQIIIDSNCNLSCEYCILLYKNQLYRTDRSITYNVIDKYVEFFAGYYDDIMKYYRQITIVFFGGEPLLSFPKIMYFMERLYNYENIHFVIHTNGVLVNKNLIQKLQRFDSRRFSFAISIDGNLETMLKYRLKNKTQFYKILRGVRLLRKEGIDFIFSCAIMKPSANDLFHNLKYLLKLNPKGIVLNIVTSIYAYREEKSNKEILKGVRRFLDYLLKERGYSYREIVDILDLPRKREEYKDFLKFGINITGDIDGTVYAMTFSWQGFDEGVTFTKEELDTITLGNVIFNETMLKNNICRYDLFSDQEIWRVTYQQQRKRAKPERGVQNALAMMFLSYLKPYYLSNE